MKNTRALTLVIQLSVLAVAVLGLYPLRPKAHSRFEQVKELPVETRVAVQVEEVTLQTLRHYVTAYGFVEAEPAVVGKAAASARITAPVAGIVAEVHCVEGQQVEKGQPLFTLDSRKLDSAIEQAREVLAAAEHHSQQQEQASKQEAVPLWLRAQARQERDRARSDVEYALAQKVLLRITAPLSGTVTYLNVRPGEVTDPESPAPLVELTDLKRLIVAANIPSYQLPAIQVGQSVEIFPQRPKAADSFGVSSDSPSNQTGLAVMGKIAFVEDRVDPKTDLGLVDISLPPGAGFRPGQFVRARIIIEESRDSLTVPSRSLVKNESGEWVVSMVSGKRAIQSPVKVGFREGDLVQVQSLMLQPGDKVVTTGAYGLPEKSKIRVLNQ